MKAEDTKVTWERLIIDPRRKRRIVVCVLFVGMLTFMFTRPAMVLWEAVSKIRVVPSSRPSGMQEDLLRGSEADVVETHRVCILGQRTLIRVACRLRMLPDEYLAQNVHSIIRERFNEPVIAEVVRDLRDRMEVRQEGKTNILSVHVRALHPKEAQDLADAVAEEYMDQTNKENNANLDRVREFVEKELMKAQERVRMRQQELQTLRTSVLGLAVQGSAALVSERGGLAQRHKLVDEQIQQLTQLQASKDGRDAPVVLLGGHDDEPLIEQLSVQLAKRQVEMCELLGHKPPDSAEVKELRGRIDGLSKGALHALSGVQRRLESRLARVSELLKAAPQIEMDLARAESSAKAAQATLTKLASVKRDVDIKQQERVATVWIEERASGAREIKRPGKFVKVVVGCLVGIALGLVWSSRTVERKLTGLIQREWGAEPGEDSEPVTLGPPVAEDTSSDEEADAQV